MSFVVDRFRVENHVCVPWAVRRKRLSSQRGALGDNGGVRKSFRSLAVGNSALDEDHAWTPLAWIRFCCRFKLAVRSLACPVSDLPQVSPMEWVLSGKRRVTASATVRTCAAEQALFEGDEEGRTLATLVLDSLRRWGGSLVNHLLIAVCVFQGCVRSCVHCESDQAFCWLVQ